MLKIECEDCGIKTKANRTIHCWVCDRTYCIQCYSASADTDYCMWCDDNGSGKGATEIWNKAIDECVDTVSTEPCPEGIVDAVVITTRDCIVARMRKLKREVPK